NGVGDFSPPLRYSLASPTTRLDPTGVVIADFDGDGNPDIAVSCAWDNSVMVLKGLGGGRFQTPPLRFAVGVGLRPGDVDPRAIAVADMDNDGKLDIVTANFTENSISVLRGRGDGTFEPAVNSPVGALTNPRALAIQDLDNDGNPDVVTANFGTANCSVLLGLGTGRLSPAMYYSTGSGPHGIALADFNA